MSFFFKFELFSEFSKSNLHHYSALPPFFIVFFFYIWVNIICNILRSLDRNFWKCNQSKKNQCVLHTQPPAFPHSLTPSTPLHSHSLSREYIPNNKKYRYLPSTTLRFRLFCIELRQ